VPRGDVLNAKQARFAAHYVKCLNATEAARLAGYSETSVRAIGSQLLGKPHVKAEISRLEAIQLGRIGLTAESVLEQLRRIAFFDPSTIYEIVRKRLTLVQAGDHDLSKKAQAELVWVDELGKYVEDYVCQPGEQRLSEGAGAIRTIRLLKHPTDWPIEARTALGNYETVIKNVTAGDGMVDQVLKIKFEPKLQALEMLAKHLGLLTEKVETNSTISIQWLPPEPPPDQPQLKVIESKAVRVLPESTETTDLDLQGKNGSPAAAPAPAHRTRRDRFSETELGSIAEVDSQIFSDSEPESELQRSSRETGMSERSLRRMFPELKDPNP
jgi:hypothetical protein